MSSPKSSIKSKKTKFIQKNSEGSVKSAKVIEIESSDEECVVEQIQKRRKKQSIQNSTPVKLNNFNLERFKKVEYIPMAVNEPELVIVECLNEEQMTHNNIKAVFYRVEGREKTEHVSDFYLHERIKKMLPSKDETKTQSPQVVQQQEKMKKVEVIQSSEDEKQDKVEQKNKPLRYFDIIDEKDEQKRLVKCFNCGKRGHIAKNCLQQRQKQKCMYCLGEHHHHDCNARACFRCNQIGHVAQECKAVGIDCHKCGKKGHVQKNCGSVIFMDYSKFKKDRQFRDKYQAEDLKKLRCMLGCKFPYGHFNCHEYMDKKTKPYQGTTTKPQPKYQNQKQDRQTPRLFQKYQKSLMRQDPASMNNRYVITNYGGNYQGQGQYRNNDYEMNGSWRGNQNQNQNQVNRNRGYQIQNYGGNGRGSSNQRKNGGGFKGRYDTGRW